MSMLDQVERFEPDDSNTLTDAAIAAIRDGTSWYCGRCHSVIPLDYWHRCDNDGTHTAPVSRTY